MAKVFVSYTSADQLWAFWIAEQLQALGHEPFVHEWELPHGHDVPAWMHRRMDEADHCACVISDAYLAAKYSAWERCAAEWASQKHEGFCLPIFIEACAAPFLTAVLKRVDLHGIDEATALARLASMVCKPSPTSGTSFPPNNAAKSAAATPARFPGVGRPPSSAPPAVASPTPPPFPADPGIVGRDDRRAELVAAILASNAPIIVTGGPGIGKTALALSSAHDPQVKACFGDGRIFVRLDAALEPRAILAGIAGALGLGSAGDDGALLAAIRARAASTAVLAILDNAETPWIADGAGTEGVLDHLSGIEGLTAVLTIRGETPRVTNARRLGDVRRLDFLGAKALFLRWAGPSFAADPQLDTLLQELDGHPLSIVLMAGLTDGVPDLGLLARRWRKRRIELISDGDDRLRSVRASLATSLAHPRLAAGSPGRRLLSLLALLPAGMAEEDCEILLPDAGDEGSDRLQKLRLAEAAGGRLRMLAPLREAALLDAAPDAEDRARLVQHYLGLAADGEKIGTGAWAKVGPRVRTEADNLDPVCLLPKASKSITKAVRGLGKFHEYTGLATVASLRSVTDKLAKNGCGSRKRPFAPG